MPVSKPNRDFYREMAAIWDGDEAKMLRDHLRAVLDIIATDSRYDENVTMMSARAALCELEK